MRCGSGSAEKWTEAGNGGRNAIRRGNHRVLPDRTARGREISRRDRRPIGLKEHPARTIRSKRFNRILATASKRVWKTVGYVNSSGREGVSGRRVTASPARCIVLQLAQDGIHVHESRVTRYFYDYHAQADRQITVQPLKGRVCAVLNSGRCSKDCVAGGIEHEEVVVVR